MPVNNCCCGCYRQARNCSNNTLANVWMTCTDAAMFPNAFSIGSNCYYFNFADATHATAGGTVYAASAAVAAASCSACPTPAPCECPTVCMNYILKAHVKRDYYLKPGATGCAGAIDHSCEGDIAIEVANTNVTPCTWGPFSGVPGFPSAICDAVTPAQPYITFDTVGTTLGLISTPPCKWAIQFDSVDETGTISASYLSESAVGATPATPGAIYPNLTFCEEFTLYWIKTTISAITVVCDDAP